MCGIAGLLTSGRLDRELLKRMGDVLAHRGPDDNGLWSDSEAGIGLSHRRLAVVDVSPLGHQPMLSSDGRLVLSFNGEIYNHRELRRELEGSGKAPAWRGHSDTETLVACIAAWGLEQTLERSVGMFAISLWDRRERTLRLARDRFGEKPLYYGWVGQNFVFASQLKAIRLHPQFSGEVDHQSVELLLRRGYVPAPLSIYRGIHKLEPGCILTATRESAREATTEPPTAPWRGKEFRIDRYWSYAFAVDRGLRDPIRHEQEALEALEQALANSIRGQSMADVPVGAFLSGGVDSSTVVAFWQKYSSSPVRTFTVGFEDPRFDESAAARAVAGHLGTEHFERVVTVEEASDAIPRLSAIYDEPFADSSQIPTYFVSCFAREQVTVALTGDGGDELFGGYNRHVQAAGLWRRMQRVPSAMRLALGSAAAMLPASVWNSLAKPLLGGRRPPHFGHKVQRALRAVGSASSLQNYYGSFTDEWWQQPSPVHAGGLEQVPSAALSAGVPDEVRMMYWDTVGYLPDDILCKVDRAAMSVSLESRVPFLDHRFAELAARIPVGMKIDRGKGKHILRRLLYREAPRELFERPKAGFAVPVGEWIRGPLRPWAEELLDERRLCEGGLLKAPIVRKRWADHLAGGDFTQALWPILMLQAWLSDTHPTAGAERSRIPSAISAASRSAS